jgi:hypothetical protein
LEKTGENTWGDQGIKASIINGGKSFKVSLPFAKMGNPKTMEVSFMASP